MKILIINGPNLNLLGKREPDIYGNQSFDEYLNLLKELYPQISLTYLQSNNEGSLLDCLHKEGFIQDGIIINAGAYTHTSIAIADAIASVTTPVIEVHISNVFKREPFRQHSYLSPVVKGVIGGFGMNSYRLAIEAFINQG